MNIRHVRSLLPIELEKTRETPAMGMPIIPKSSSSTAVRVPVTLPHFTVPQVPLGQERVERQNRGGDSVTAPANAALPVAVCVRIIGPAGVYAIFRAVPTAITPGVMNQMERRERVVFLLLDGKRTLRDVARLVHRSELDVARILVCLLKQQYIEYIRA